MKSNPDPNHARIRALCAHAIALARPSLPVDGMREVDGFMDHDEWGLAVETLIDIAEELDLVLDRAAVDALADALSAMGLGDSPRANSIASRR